MNANPINITRIDHVVIRVRNLDAMIDFYCDVLGCRLERGPGEAGLAQLRAGESLIDLVDAAGSLGRQAGGKIRQSCFVKAVDNLINFKIGHSAFSLNHKGGPQGGFSFRALLGGGAQRK